MKNGNLRDKVYGCWLGKSIGGTLGAPFECRKEVLHLSFYDPVPKESVPNDDLDLQLVWLNLLRKKGFDIAGRDFAKAWLKNITYNFDEYGVVKSNLKMGLIPPASGYYNNWFQNGMGAAIRSEIWAVIAPGKPEVAAYYAYQDASVDHYGEGIYGEIFMAALESAAFVDSDRNRLIKTGLAFFPKTSRVSQAVTLLCSLYRQKVSWLEARQALLDRFGQSNMSDCVQNIGFIILGLLYGEGDFEKTILSAVNCGYDSDCTAATAGAIMGIILGAKKIPKKWKAPIGNRIAVDSRIVGIKAPENLFQLTEETMAIGRFAAKSKIRVLSKPFILPSVEVVAPPLSFPFLLNGKKSVSFTDCHFNLSAYFKKIPGKIRLATCLVNPVSRKVRVLPACNDGVKLWLDGKLILSHHDHNPIRPAPHYPEKSRFVDVSLSKGNHRVVLEISCCRKPIEFSWMVGEWDERHSFPLLTDVRYFLEKTRR